MAKKSGGSGVLMLAIVLGLAAAYGIWYYLRQQGEADKKNWQPVVVAVMDIKPRTTITREMVSVTTYPKEHIAEGAITDLKDVEGRITMARIKSKEQLRQSDLVEKGKTPTLAIEIPPGKRAVAIAANEVSAVGSSVKPGDRVDVLATWNDPISKQETTQMILQNVPVLAVNEGQTDGAGAGGAKTSMTLAVSPEEVELLTAADRSGVLRVSLRPLGDDRIIASPGITVRDLGTGKSIEPVVVSSQPATGSDVKATPIIISPPPSRTKPEITEIRGTTKVVTTP